MSINNLYVTYDDEGTQHFHINDEEVTREVWMLRHPNMKEGKPNGGNRNSAGVGRVGDGSVSADGSDAKERQRQGVRDHRAKLRAEAAQAEAEGDQEAGGERAGSGEDAVG